MKPKRDFPKFATLRACKDNMSANSAATALDSVGALGSKLQSLKVSCSRSSSIDNQSKMELLDGALSGLTISSTQGISDKNDNALNMKSSKTELDIISSTMQKPQVNRTKKNALSSFHTQRVPLPALTNKEKESRLGEVTAAALNLENKENANGVKAAVLLCKFIQCLLWDVDFRFTPLNYQYDAILAAIGIDVKKILDIFVKWKDASRPSILLKQTKKGRQARMRLCRDCITFVNTRGLLIADAMGLGKTVEAMGAALLRSHIAENQRIRPGSGSGVTCSLPCLVLAPSDAFLNQWESTLVISGLPASHISRFSRDDAALPERGFVLVTLHNLMTEVRRLFKSEGSILFPDFGKEFLTFMKELRDAGGKAEEVTQAMSTIDTLDFPHRFQSFIIDEAHSFRNLVTYAGIGAALLGLLSDRTIPMSATPYVESTQDMATLMTFIDPSLKAAYKLWWKETTQEYVSDSLLNEVRDFRRLYMIRRERNVLTKELVGIETRVVNVKCNKSELDVYKRYESLFFATFENFQNSTDPDLTIGKKELTSIMLSYLINMRMSLVHPLIPKGREFTVRFSPSRRHMEAKLTRKLCVFCSHDNGNDLIPMPIAMCHATNSPTCHFAHESCLRTHTYEGTRTVECPRCNDFKSRSRVCTNSSDIRSTIYCQTVNVAQGVSGFQATSKLKSVVEWVQSLPKDDKTIIYSFFEGSLDLLEGIFIEHLGIDCARLDNDTSPELQAHDLTRFKTTPSCRILLATVQSCGSGLNIDEANHVAFLDRWFDARILEQAQDRVHNLNQHKGVKVVYFDTSITVDNVMRAINDAFMSPNATVSLADGTVVGSLHRSVRYQEITGPIYRMMKDVSEERDTYLNASSGELISASEEFLGQLMNSANGKSIDSSSSQKAASPMSILKTTSVDSGSTSENSNPTQELKCPSSDLQGNGSDRKSRRVVFAPLPGDDDVHVSSNVSCHQIQKPRPLFARQNTFHSPPKAYHPQSVQSMNFTPSYYNQQSYDYQQAYGRMSTGHPFTSPPQAYPQYAPPPSNQGTPTQPLYGTTQTPQMYGTPHTSRQIIGYANGYSCPLPATSGQNGAHFPPDFRNRSSFNSDQHW